MFTPRVTLIHMVLLVLLWSMAFAWRDAGIAVAMAIGRGRLSDPAIYVTYAVSLSLIALLCLPHLSEWFSIEGKYVPVDQEGKPLKGVYV